MAFSDPGIVPLDKESQVSTIVELIEKDALDSLSVCTESMMKRPLRAKYDRFSRNLIAKFDHFCPWVNNAVGALNHKVYTIGYRLFIIYIYNIFSVFCILFTAVSTELNLVCDSNNEVLVISSGL